MGVIQIIFILWCIVVVLVVAFWLFRMYFRRDPKRKIPRGKVIVSPADGTIMAVVDVEKEIRRNKGIGKVRAFCKDVDNKCALVAIFMSPLSVHFQRAPLSGRVVSVKHVPGEFRPSQYLRHGLRNEKTETLFKTRLGKMKVVQIAGIFVRRIDNWAQAGKTIPTGRKFGFIHFGSQVWLILPKKEGIRISVNVGDKVYAGKSIIARY